MQVLLQPSREVLAKRVAARTAEGTHFMPASLLDSQLALMEVDPEAYRYGEALICSLAAFFIELRRHCTHVLFRCTMFLCQFGPCDSNISDVGELCVCKASKSVAM